VIGDMMDVMFFELLILFYCAAMLEIEDFFISEHKWAVCMVMHSFVRHTAFSVVAQAVG
jgi:hypothetical protein